MQASDELPEHFYEWNSGDHLSKHHPLRIKQKVPNSKTLSII